MIPLRDDQDSRTFPGTTLLIIVLNAYVFAMWQMKVGLQTSVDRLGFTPIELTTHTQGAWAHLFSAMFMHGGWMHLIGNMWFLFIFGQRIEDNCGHIRFLIFYLLCGVAATLAYTGFSPQSEMPLVGASGAISGVLGAYLLHHPRASILSIVPLGPIIRIMNVPAWVFLLFWIGFQVFSQAMAAQARQHHIESTEHGGVAYVAHIGGFIAGMVLITFFERRAKKQKRQRALPGAMRPID